MVVMDWNLARYVRQLYFTRNYKKNEYQQFDRSSTLKTLLSLYTSGGGSQREVSIYPLYF